MTEKDDLQMEQLAAGELPASAKTMIRVVYIMGIVMVLLFLVLIGSVIWKSTHRQQADNGKPPPVTDLGLPPGTVVQSMVLTGDRLAVSTGSEVIVVDIRKNVILSRVRVSKQ